MNTNRLMALFSFTILIVAALFITNFVTVTSSENSFERQAQAEQADVARWEALGIAYTGVNPRAREAEVQRWAGMGDTYSKQAAPDALLDAMKSREADAARWQALGEFYTAPDVRARAADVARWEALGEAYTGINPRAREADVMRWQALGEAILNH